MDCLRLIGTPLTLVCIRHTLVFSRHGPWRTWTCLAPETTPVTVKSATPSEVLCCQTSCEEGYKGSTAGWNSGTTPSATLLRQRETGYSWTWYVNMEQQLERELLGAEVDERRYPSLNSQKGRQRSRTTNCQHTTRIVGLHHLPCHRHRGHHNLQGNRQSRIWRSCSSRLWKRGSWNCRRRRRLC